MKKINKVSVIVPTYNDNKQKLIKTVESVLSQTYPSVELIIVNSGRAIGNFTKAKLVDTPPRGVADAFNVGIKEATGNYFYFMGAGDFLWDKQVVSKVMDDIGGELLICGKINRMDEKGKNILYTSNLVFKKWNLLYKMGLPHQGLFTHRKFFDKYGLFDVNCKYAMDYELLLRAYKTWPRVNFKDVIVAGWCAGGIGMDKTKEIMEEYHRIRINNKIAPKFFLSIIYLLSRLRYGIV